MKTRLKELSLEELENIFSKIGEKRFRAEQVFQWVYQKNVSIIEEMTNVSKELQSRLNEIFEIGKISLLKKYESKDGTTKFLFELEDNKKIESVLIPPISINRLNSSIDNESLSRLTVCISTQVGCALGCQFCATSAMKFKRNLSSFEIIDQILQIQNFAKKKITNIVFMGMGEPLLNYDNVLKSIEIISHDLGMSITKRHITVSTAGIIPGIIRIADDNEKFKLAVSLHSLDNQIRTKLMPINRKYPLSDLIDSIKHYYRKTKLRPTFEMVLFDGINDTENDLKKIVALSKQIPSKFNFIKFHESAFLNGNLKKSKKFNKFIEKLRKHGLTVMIRNSSGEDISAACGQLAIE